MAGRPHAARGRGPDGLSAVAPPALVVHHLDHVRTAVRIAPAYSGATLYVSDASRAPAVLGREIGDLNRLTDRIQKCIVRNFSAKAAVEIAVYKEGDANTVRVAEGVRERMEEVREELPPGVATETVDDQSVFIQRAISEVVNAAILGGLIEILVLYGFLRDSRATTIVTIANPVSVIGTFLLMYTRQNNWS